ncbi:MAG: hypothetical protein ACYTBJ_13505 [Planctomycetota bacterium]
MDKVYRFVQFVANKESRGWVSPEEFNVSAELAQIIAYSKREAVFLASKKILNDMRPFMKMSAAITPASGLCAYPADHRHFNAGWMDSDFQEIQELTQAELSAAMKSEIDPPTASYPAGVQRDTGLQLYPVSISADIRMEYIASPIAPEWAYTVVSGRPVYASGSSTDFGFDEILFLEIAMSILSNIGVNIGEENVAQYGMAFNQQS